MKAIVYEKYGPPDIVLQLKEVEKPTPKDNEVLVKVHAASVNYSDWSFVRGDPFISRMFTGLLKPKNTILGTDIAGQVEAIGRNVKRFQPGDEVYGEIFECGMGGFAEYVSVTENVLAPKPTNMTFEEAAAVPQAAIVGLQGLRDKGQIQHGQKVLINGASGGNGTFAVQIAKSFGAEVTGVCSTRNVELVRSIGADHVIDYTQEDFTKSEQRYDLILDIVANRSISDYMRALSPNGNYVAVAFNPVTIFLGSLISMTGSKKMVSLTTTEKTKVKDLVYMKELIEAGKVVPVIDRSYPLSEAAEAIRYYGERHTRGKVVITVVNNDKT
jgi:NADPH:quinone reductase-like Zn-dependent oxidoreductase